MSQRPSVARIRNRILFDAGAFDFKLVSDEVGGGINSARYVTTGCAVTYGGVWRFLGGRRGNSSVSLKNIREMLCGGVEKKRVKLARF